MTIQIKRRPVWKQALRLPKTFYSFYCIRRRIGPFLPSIYYATILTKFCFYDLNFKKEATG